MCVCVHMHLFEACFLEKYVFQYTMVSGVMQVGFAWIRVKPPVGFEPTTSRLLCENQIFFMIEGSGASQKLSKVAYEVLFVFWKWQKMF